jgi:hypothetical protein
LERSSIVTDTVKCEPKFRKEGSDHTSTSALAHRRNLIAVAAETADVLFDPLQCNSLIMEAIVCFVTSLA